MSYLLVFLFGCVLGGWLVGTALLLTLKVVPPPWVHHTQQGAQKPAPEPTTPPRGPAGTSGMWHPAYHGGQSIVPGAPRPQAQAAPPEAPPR